MRATTLALTAALLAASSPPPAAAQPERAARAGPYSFELVDEAGATLPTFQHRGRTYALGSVGQRYLLRVHNAGARRVEVVASVDGRDVVDGLPAAWEKRGYVVEPYGSLTIDGFRLSEGAVAAFRFTTVPRSYAARMGDARDVGVVGVAFFPERWRPPLPVPLPFGGRDRLQRPEARAPAEGGAAGDASGAPAPSASGAPEALAERERATRRGLGTEFGEEHASAVRHVAFERASARPDGVLTLRYDDRDGLLALGVDPGAWVWSASEEAWLRESAEPFRRDFAEPPPGWDRRGAP
jgi:hypothetical protein